MVLASLFGTSPALAARDRKPPTKPTNLRATSLTPHNVTLAWNPSTDDSGTFQASIMYEVYLNGVLDHATTGNRAVVYVTQTGDNTITLIAVDGAGNRSEPSTVTFFVQ